MSQFSQIPVVSVPRYHRFPLGDGQSHFLNNIIGAYPELFVNQPPLAPGVLQMSRPGLVKRGDSNLSTASLVSSDSSGGTDLDIGMCYVVFSDVRPFAVLIYNFSDELGSENIVTESRCFFNFRSYKFKLDLVQKSKRTKDST